MLLISSVMAYTDAQHKICDHLYYGILLSMVAPMHNNDQVTFQFKKGHCVSAINAVPRNG